MSNLQEASDLSNNVSISARRFEESPFIARTDCPEMIRGVYAGRYFPIFIGEDYLDKYWCLRQKALIFDVPEKPVEISGPDVVPFLEKIFARKVATMTQGRGYYAIACTPQGGVFMDGVMFRLGENRFWYVQADGPFETWLLAHSGGFDVTISDPESRVLQIQGPASMAIMNAASGGAIDETLKYFRSGYYDLGGQQLYVSRTGFTNELGYEIYCDGPNTDHLALWDLLMACGTPHGMEFSSTRALTIRRIEGGILGNLTDMTPDMTPFEAGLAPFIDMGKGDFIGREALVGKDTRSCLFGLTCETETPAAGSDVIDGDMVVGRITAGIPSPTLGLGVGYVHFRSPGDWVGRTLSMRLPDGTVHAGQIVEVPFFDREKNIVRGVDRTIPERPAV
ncbi:aminomethyltransferase family protein [Roseovarius aestuarii]|uniref:Aminomethyltransferase n=1 Tax=Roseovarius aestuarii TaxID=475083 RepID=A0A1X7BQB0_9RHOB|nr:aminomethyltransferase family protein [Roseovarius aestuarii]SMC11389.1 Aminomethyltransferase [Roseovarius aestuarii]